MGGGEVARYVGTYGRERVMKAVFMAAIPPFLLKTADNPTGVEGAVFEGIKQAIAADRPAFLSKFLADFYNVDQLRGSRISDEVVRLSWTIAAGASPAGTLACVSAWLTDFRKDLQRFTIPTLVVHGDSDRVVPVANGRALAARIPASELVLLEGVGHYPYLEQPERFAAVVRRFLERVESG
jgi:pimeloyl-ACP methyl ester carboxylesterase